LSQFFDVGGDGNAKYVLNPVFGQSLSHVQQEVGMIAEIEVAKVFGIFLAYIFERIVRETAACLAD